MYIQLINKTYRYRYKLPKDINVYFPANEITKSLHTNDIQIAKVKAMKIHSTIVEIIHKVRMSRNMSLLTDLEIYNMTEKYLSERLESDYSVNSFYLTKQEANMLKSIAQAKDITMSVIVRKLVQDAISES